MTAKFSNKIKEIREQKGWSIRRAAKLIGISHTRLMELETGISSYRKKTKPSIENIVKIAKIYELSIVDLIKLAGIAEYKIFLEELYILKDDEKELLECYRDLGRHKKAEILNMLKIKTSRQSHKPSK